MLMGSSLAWCCADSEGTNAVPGMESGALTCKVGAPTLCMCCNTDPSLWPLETPLLETVRTLEVT